VASVRAVRSRTWVADLLRLVDVTGLGEVTPRVGTSGAPLAAPS